jgi:Na+/proline symporter
VLVAAFGGGYAIFAIWIYGFMGFFLVQLLYVIPLILWLKRRGRIGMMQGVIGMAVVTALLNGACFLASFAPTIGR